MGGEDLDVPVLEQRLAARDVDLTDHVELVAEQPRDDGGLLGVERGVDAVERRVAAPPAGEALVLRADTWRVRRDLEGASRLRLARERAELVVGRQDDRLVGGRARQVGEVRVRRVERELDGEVVDPLDPAGREDARERRQRRRVLADQPLVGGDDVVRAARTSTPSPSCSPSTRSRARAGGRACSSPASGTRPRSRPPRSRPGRRACAARDPSSARG